MNASPELPSIDAAAAAAMGSAVVLLDVREDDEWTGGHAPDAVHIPLGELPARADQLDGTRRIVCICRSGNRSARATTWLRDRGIDAVNLDGGMRAWADAGLPIVDEHGRSGVVG
jgi:rhodanese-related sulfurtransferase